MENISDEIKIIDAEIEKMEKAILREVEDYKEVKRENLNHFKQYNDIPPKAAEIFKEAKKILVDAMLNGNKDLEAHEHTIKDLQSRLNTLKQSRENKLNKIVFREDLEEVGKLQKEAEELKQRRAELSAKYANPKKARQAKLLRGKKQPFSNKDKLKEFLSAIIKKYPRITLDKKANMVISEMKGRRLFLNNKNEPVYKKSTIKKMLSELNNTKKTKGKS